MSLLRMRHISRELLLHLIPELFKLLYVYQILPPVENDIHLVFTAKFELLIFCLFTNAPQCLIQSNLCSSVCNYLISSFHHHNIIIDNFYKTNLLLSLIRYLSHLIERLNTLLFESFHLQMNHIGTNLIHKGCAH